MIVIATSGLVSFVLMMRASAVRPSQLRAADYRSPQGYAYHNQRAMIRRQGWMCAFAAFMTLAVCVMMGLVQLAYNVD